MNLHVETRGNGKPLVMLHGWGMHGGIWSDIAAQLAQDFEVHSVDLPGHGKSAWTGGDFSLEAIVAALSRRFATPAHVCGWSLGGMIAQHWALCAPQQVGRVVLVASTPCFAARPDWQFGMPQATLEQFAAELEKDFSATLRRFLALQVRGSDHERDLLGVLRERLFSRGEPDLAALRGGLAILREADLRPSLARIAQPMLAIAGERDKLTPAHALHHLARMAQNARVVEIKGAAHAPFLSHPAVFIEHLKSFLHE